MNFRSALSTLALAGLLSAALLHAQSPSPLATPPNGSAEDISDHESAMVREIRTNLVAEKFDDIDRLADELRRSRSRWVGGDWKLRTLYKALDDPRLTDKDTPDHLEHLRHWMTQRPESITARIALATSLHRWAWVARGSGTADKVTEEGWLLFNQRIKESQTVLQSCRDMKVMDPQWYAEEMTVGLAQGWDKRQMKDLFDRAVQFEPEFRHFYVMRANYLLPKWYGDSAHDATDFAKQSADRLGGDKGDMMYFIIATEILHRGNGNIDPFVKAMDWQRIRRGYKVLAEEYGIDNREKNQLAFMAYKYGDHEIAQMQFASIGDKWNSQVWKERTFYDRIRDWANHAQQWP